MLELIFQYGFVTRRLLTDIYAAERGRGRWHIARELRTLYDAEYLERFLRPGVAGEGSYEFIYTVTRQGARLILSAEDYDRHRHDVYQRSRQTRANFEHHLILAALQYIVRHAGQSWQLVSFTAEDRNPSSRRSINIGRKNLTLWPDARSVIEFPGEGDPHSRRVLVLWEVDLNRKNKQRTQDRFTAYAKWLPQLKRELAGKVNNVLTVFAATSEEIVTYLIREAATSLNELSSRERPQFLFWNAGDWYRDEVRQARRSRHDVELHQWTVPVLRPPAEIMNAESFTTLAGQNRQLL